MFKLQQKPLVWWPVTIKVPVDGGQISEHEIQVQFELLDQDKYDELALKGDSHVVKQITKNWKDIADEHGETLPFNEDNLALLTNKIFVRTGILFGYMSAVSGAPIKN